MNLTIIVAISENNVIGKGGEIPWHIPEDLKRFKKLTVNHPVIMGRKTFDSVLKILERPLPERKNIVLTRQNLSYKGIYIANSVLEAINLCDKKDSYVMGGREIYDLFLPYVNKMEITRVHKKILGDVFFPIVNWNEWEEINKEHKKEYSFLTYKKIKT